MDWKLNIVKIPDLSNSIYEVNTILIKELVTPESYFLCID